MNHDEPTTLDLIFGTLSAAFLLAVLWTLAAIL